MITEIDAAVGTNLDVLRRARLLTNTFFQLIILPTEQCNFRCTYCYEDFSIGRMKKETVLATKALLTRRADGLRRLIIEWFGGEPLVAKDIVYEISEHALQLAQLYPDLDYAGSMTTNGYFLDLETATHLSNLGVRTFQISLDGSEEIHNRSRRRADGRGTFERIWNNLLAIRSSSIQVNVVLRIHFTADTVQLLDSLLSDIKQEFLVDPRFSVFFKGIEHLGGPNDASISTLPFDEKLRAIKNLESKVRGSAGDAVNIRPEEAMPLCYAARANSLIIRANGDVGKCTVMLSDERNKVGTLKPDGSLEINRERLAPWIRGISTLDPEELACPLVHLPPLK